MFKNGLKTTNLTKSKFRIFNFDPPPPKKNEKGENRKNALLRATRPLVIRFCTNLHQNV